MKQEKILIEDEIDLRELFKIIWNKKVFIIIFTFITTVLAWFYAYSKIPIYEVKSYIEIGYINKEKIEDIDSLEQKLKVIFEVENPTNKIDGLEKGIVSSIKQIKGVKNFLEIKTEATNNELALNKNKEVLKFIQESSQESIKQYEIVLDNAILNKKREIDFINEINIKNIKSEIEILREQELKNIDTKIAILKNQNIESVNKEINLLKTQEIPKLKAQINFLKNSKIKSLKDKIVYYSKSLNSYINELDKINKNTIKSDNTTAMVASVQILNYQNLITNAQNQIKDLELQIEVIQNQTIPDLKYKLENITNVQIKNLEYKKANIINVDLKDLENKKINVSNEKIRKLEDKINIELQTKISQLNEEIDTLNFKKSEQNLSNTKLVGEYIINDFPVKPKKSLIVIVAFITGFILSIFLTFLLNFISKSKIDYIEQHK